MPAILWGDWIKTGIDDIDNDHRHLIEIGNALFDTNLIGLGKEDTLNLIRTFRNFIMTHFSREERIMIDNKYEGYQSHKSSHSLIIESVGQLESKIEQESDIAPDIAAILAHFAFYHLDGDDRALAEYIKQLETPILEPNKHPDHDDLSDALLAIMRSIIFHEAHDQEVALETSASPHILALPGGE